LFEIVEWLNQFNKISMNWRKQQKVLYLRCSLKILKLKSKTMNIPITLIAFRLLLVPIILGLAYFVGHKANLLIIVFMFLGLISDILDFSILSIVALALSI